MGITNERFKGHSLNQTGPKPSSGSGSGLGFSKFKVFNRNKPRVVAEPSMETPNLPSPNLTMADQDEVGNAHSGSTLSLLNNNIHSTGNVQSKAAAFTRLNSSNSGQGSQSSKFMRQQTVSSSTHHHHHSNETSSSMSTQSSSSQQMKDLRATMKQLGSMTSSTSSSSSSSSSSQVSSSSSSSMSSANPATSPSLGPIQLVSKGAAGLAPLNLTDAQRLAVSGEKGGQDDPLETGQVCIQELQFPSSPEFIAPLALQPISNSHLSDSKDSAIRTVETKMASSSSSSYSDGNVRTQHAMANAAASKMVQSGDIKYQENESTVAQSKSVEVDGVKAEHATALKQGNRYLTQGGVTEKESHKAAAAKAKLSTGSFEAEKLDVTAEKRKETWLANGTVVNREKHRMDASQSKLTIFNQINFWSKNHWKGLSFEDMFSLGWNSDKQDIQTVIDKYSTELTCIVDGLKDEKENKETVQSLQYASKVIEAAWKVPGHGQQVGHNLCDNLRKIGGLDLLIENISSHKRDLRKASARLLEQSLTFDNCNYVIEKECLDKIVQVASELCEAEESNVGTGLLCNLFKHSEAVCNSVLRLRGLETVMAECRRMDVETLRNCAGALVNLSLYGGAENQEAMIKKKAHVWLFPLAFHQDDSIQYYACLAIAVLVANKEIEAQVLKSRNYNIDTLQLVEPFLTKHDPEEFASSLIPHGQGQSAQWLEKLVPVLSSDREESRSLAAFHFCMEAGLKKRHGTTEIFRKINVIEPLKRVASSPTALASKFAAQALRLIGENVPHKLSQQVPLWSIEDVRAWVVQKGFDDFADSFVASKVDGDLLLQLTEENLKEDIQIRNGILRKRFMRDLQQLKKMADYSSVDSSNLNEFLNSIHPEFCTYTYTLLNYRIDKDTLLSISEEMLTECGVQSGIDRQKIIRTVALRSTPVEEDKGLDVFISYRRNNGSQLASLLMVHLKLQGFSVFIDVERLEAGKFDNNLLQHIQKCKHFLLVLTPNALDRCVGDEECKDWVHKEVVAALDANRNIIPIMDSSFTWPQSEILPEDMRPLTAYNGVKWIHEYQDACVEKLASFLRGESAFKKDVLFGNTGYSSPSPNLSSSSSSNRALPQYTRAPSIGSDCRSEA